MVQKLVNSVKSTDPALSRVLQTISLHENIPRKKPKFMVHIVLFMFYAILRFYVLDNVYHIL